ncbi:MAG: GyrI-like domain-containing protein [Xanthobacteraceae bacterium]
MSRSRFVSVAVTAMALATVSSLVSAQTPPAAAPAPAAPSAPAPSQPAAPAQSTDPFGEETTLEGKTFIFKKGTATWDSAYETVVAALKSVYAFLDKQGLKASGPALTVYLTRDDIGFQYQAGVPIAQAPKNPPTGDIAVGTSPSGRAYKFVYRGSYDGMDTTYEAIGNFFDEKQLDAEVPVEEYLTDPVKTPDDKLVVNIFVTVKPH